MSSDRLGWRLAISTPDLWRFGKRGREAGSVGKRMVRKDLKKLGLN